LEKTFFIWEAVTQYLPEESVRKTFDYLAQTRLGSLMIFTYIRKDFIEGKTLHGHKYLYEHMVMKDKSWLFGMDPNEVNNFLSAYGWRVREHLGYDELAEIYVKPTGRKLLSTHLERIVLAQKI
jgi:methyltransferase (TIGR00027 family)